MDAFNIGSKNDEKPWKIRENAYIFGWKFPGIPGEKFPVPGNIFYGNSRFLNPIMYLIPISEIAERQLEIRS